MNPENLSNLARLNINQTQFPKKVSQFDDVIDETYPLDLSEACRLLNEVLATELVCKAGFKNQLEAIRDEKCNDLKQILSNYADNKEKHILKLEERINHLGGDVDTSLDSALEISLFQYNPGNHDSVEGSLHEDLVGERVLVDVYQKLINWFGYEDRVTRGILEEFLEDEKNLASVLADKIKLLNKNSTH